MDNKTFKEIVINKESKPLSQKKSGIRFIDMRLESLRSDDEMEVLLNLQELNRDLLVATDQIAEDINCQHLIKQLIELLTKFFLPDITLNAIICLNALLDINPMFTTTIIKNGGIPKILETMSQNIEYIDIAESAIKGIEKISYENPFVLLENDAFSTILNLIEFFELSLRKTAMKACVNMSKGINSLELIKKFIIPAIPNISSLAKMNGNTEIEKFILDQSILCFYNVIYSIRTYNLSKNEMGIYNQLIQYGILDNLFEVLASFLNILNDDSNSTANKNLNIYVDTFKNILKVFEILCSQSVDITNLVLNMNILEIINTILFKELGFLDQKAKFSSSNISIFAEIFALLISFFPSTNFSKSQQHVQLNRKENFTTKLMSESNKNYYVYFSEKILSILVKNIVNMPSTSTILEVIHLIELYVTYSPKDQIIIYIDPVKLSNISSKMLDSKDITYISKIITLVEIIMNTCPENFIETFIREGVIDNIKSIISCDDSIFYVPEDKSNLSNFGLKSNKIYTGSSDNQDLNNNDYNSNYSEQYNSYDDEIDFIDKSVKRTNVEIKPSIIVDPKTKLISFNNSYSNNKVIDSPNTNKSSNNMASIFNQMKSIFTKKTEQLVDNQVNPNPFEKIITNQDNLLEKQAIKPELNDKEKVNENAFKLPTLTLNNNANKLKEKKPVNNTVSLIKNKCKELIEKFFKDNIKIEEYLKMGNCNSNPQEIFTKLTNLSNLISEESQIDDSILSKLFDMLINKNQKLTFFEIEKSAIIHNLAKYIDQNYTINLEKNCEKFESMLKSPNADFLTKLKRIFLILNKENKSISDFISTLQYSISSMNCFKLYLYEYDNYKNVSHLFFAPLKQNNKIKIAFNYIKNENLFKDENTHKQLKDINDYYSQVKQIVLYLDQSENFNTISEILLSKPKPIENNIPKLKRSSKQTQSETEKQIYDEILSSIKDEDGENSSKIIEKLLEKNIALSRMAQNYSQGLESKEEDLEIEEHKQEIKSEGLSEDPDKVINTELINKTTDNKPLHTEYFTNFYVKVNQEKHKIKPTWKLIDFFREAKNLMKSDLTVFYDYQIFFEFNSLKESDSHKIDEGNNDYNQEAELDLCMLSSTLENITNYQEKLFFKYYSDHILGNKALYSIKRASPFFYLIALFELCVNNYNALFNCKERIQDMTLENHKISSLLTKQVRDPFAISSNTIPTWCKDLCQNYPFLANFNSRYLFFKTCSFDNKRSMINLAIFVKNFLGETIVDEKLLSGSTKRKKYKVDRYNLLQYVEKIYNEVGNFSGYLEIDYFNETGTGNGPTLEFYSLFTNEIREKSDIWYKTTDLSLFPLPVNEKSKSENTKLFTLIGFIIARGLFDDRLLDIPLNSLFWDIILDRPISLNKIFRIDKYLGAAIIDLSKLALEKERLLRENRKVNLEEELLYNNKRISDVDLYFILPGTNLELIENGADIKLTTENFEEYLKLINDSLCGSGVKDYITAFKQGFNTVFDINNLKCFQTSEIEEILCGSINEAWDKDTLSPNIIPNHGYDRNSLQYKYLIALMMELTATEKKKFLFFVTGCPRLPLGGFKNLNPKLTVVKKNPDIPMENPDIYLPTVMTCQNYLKIPEYSGYDIFKMKFVTAMTEGNNTFHFS